MHAAGALNASVSARPWASAGHGACSSAAIVGATSTSPGPDGGVLVRFTSAAPEVMDALRQALAASVPTRS